MNKLILVMAGGLLLLSGLALAVPHPPATDATKYNPQVPARIAYTIRIKSPGYMPPIPPDKPGDITNRVMHSPLMNWVRQVRRQSAQ